MARIRALKEQGTTIVLVSHTPRQVEQLCDTAVWLEQGVVRMIGDPGLVSRAYGEFLRTRQG